MGRLIDYYNSKWDSGYQPLIRKLSNKYPSVESNNISSKHTTGRIAVRLLSPSNKLVYVLVEYDNTERYSKNYKYGIYIGVKADSNEIVSDVDISLIWEKYQKKVLRSNKYQKDNVFLDGDVNTSDEDSYWVFWVHLEDKYELIDAYKPISVIVESLINQGFCLCHN